MSDEMLEYVVNAIKESNQLKRIQMGGRAAVERLQLEQETSEAEAKKILRAELKEEIKEDIYEELRTEIISEFKKDIEEKFNYKEPEINNNPFDVNETDDDLWDFETPNPYSSESNELSSYVKKIVDESKSETNPLSNEEVNERIDDVHNKRRRRP